MKKIKIIVVVLFGQMMFSCANNSNNKIEVIKKQLEDKSVFDTASSPVLIELENLVVRQISDHVYEHSTFLEKDNSGRVACNGIIVVNNKEAIVFDTPTNDQNSKKLIDYLTSKLHWKIKAVVATNFHDDCLGGLRSFHRNNIPSYASNRTISLAKKGNFIEPQNGFDKQHVLSLGNKKIYLEYLEEGKNKDDIIAYFPEDKLVFGGGLIKVSEVITGSFKDSNAGIWSETVRKIKLKYPQVKMILPGRGELDWRERNKVI